jgi:hypothetical protein
MYLYNSNFILVCAENNKQIINNKCIKLYSLIKDTIVNVCLSVPVGVFTSRINYLVLDFTGLPIAAFQAFSASLKYLASLFTAWG